MNIGIILLKEIYVDKISGKPLFTSEEKFHSECGWPFLPKRLMTMKLYGNRAEDQLICETEVRSEESNSHLGHVFNDGPKESGGLRYCMNSTAIEPSI